jgi:hypothetical protein
VLGEVLDLRVEQDGRRSTLSWKRPHWLCAEPGTQRLWILPMPAEEPEPLEDFDEDLRAAAKLYRRWSDLVPVGATRVQVRITSSAEFRGHVNVIGYRSSKWNGSFDEYEHIFTRPPRIERAGEVYRITGSTLRVTPGGIDG